MFIFYLVVSLLAALLLVILDLFLYKNPVNLFTVFFVLQAVVVLITLKCRNVLSESSRGKLFITLLTLPVNLVGLFLLILALVNYPPAPAYEGKISLQLPGGSATEAYGQLKQMLNNDSGCLEKDADNQGASGHLYSAECSKERQDILNFVAATRVAVPLEEKQGDVYLPIDDDPGQFRKYVNLVSAELVSVDRLLQDQETEQAQEKYLRLWRAADALLGSGNGLANVMFIDKTIEMLLDFHAHHAAVLQAIDSQLKNILKGIPGKMDNALAEAFALEFASMKSLYLYPDVSGMNYWEFQYCLFAYLQKWPLYDKNATLEVLDSWFNKHMLLSLEKADGKVIDAAELKELFSFSRTASFAGFPYDVFLPFSFSVKNPYGVYLLNLSLPVFTNIIERKNEIRQDIISFREGL